MCYCSHSVSSNPDISKSTLVLYGEVVAKKGWRPLPNVLLHNIDALCVDFPIQMRQRCAAAIKEMLVMSDSKARVQVSATVMAKRLQVSRQTAIAAIGDLTAAGLIVKRKMFDPDNGSALANVYNIKPIIDIVNRIGDNIDMYGGRRTNMHHFGIPEMIRLARESALELEESVNAV